jgi:hypothetical protein
MSDYTTLKQLYKQREVELNRFNQQTTTYIKLGNKYYLPVENENDPTDFDGNIYRLDAIDTDIAVERRRLSV